MFFFFFNLGRTRLCAPFLECLLNTIPKQILQRQRSVHPSPFALHSSPSLHSPFAPSLALRPSLALIAPFSFAFPHPNPWSFIIFLLFTLDPSSFPLPHHIFISFNFFLILVSRYKYPAVSQEEKVNRKKKKKKKRRRRMKSLIGI